MSAECDIHGCDLVYGQDSWPIGSCQMCELEAENERLRAALQELEKSIAEPVKVGDPKCNCYNYLGRMITKDCPYHNSIPCC